MSNTNELFVLHNGYSNFITSKDLKVPTMEANCSCSLIRNEKHNVIVDTMNPWDGPKIKESLLKYDLRPDQIDFVVSTHGHTDHVGNNNLFLNAVHIVGFSVSKGDKFYLHPFDEGIPYLIGGEDDIDKIEVIPTPGHTMDSVSVIAKCKDNTTVVIAGDLFEKEEDLKNPYIWVGAGSENKEKQEFNRLRILNIADYIVPGHGPMFKITEDSRTSYHKLSNSA